MVLHHNASHPSTEQKFISRCFVYIANKTPAKVKGNTATIEAKVKATTAAP